MGVSVFSMRMGMCVCAYGRLGDVLRVCLCALVWVVNVHAFLYAYVNVHVDVWVEVI